MHIIQARNVNDALHRGAQYIRSEVCVEQPSRNGPVRVSPVPVTTIYRNPTERVLLHPDRDANPFFHLIEALWMIAGRNDLKPLTEFVKNMSNFSDDGGKTQPGAYGHRWRYHFNNVHASGDWSDLDQLEWAVKRLKKDPLDRRVVIQMYDAETDQHAADNGGKDIPCNLMALPSVSTDGALNLTVYNRSNDMVFGAYGANAVHFSVLQEYIAACLGIPVGRYYQVSNNFHAYLNTLGKAGTEWPWGYLAEADDEMRWLNPDPYLAKVGPMPMFADVADQPEVIRDDINLFLEDPARVGLRSAFLRKVACPMVMAHRAYKKTGGRDGIAAGREILQQMPPINDWKVGADIWFNNREAKLNEDGR